MVTYNQSPEFGIGLADMLQHVKQELIGKRSPRTVANDQDERTVPHALFVGSFRGSLRGGTFSNSTGGRNSSAATNGRRRLRSEMPFRTAKIIPAASA